MILGIGIDLTDIRRIEDSVAQFGKKFEDRVFSKAEQKKAYSRSKSGEISVAATYAKRFAAKEACVKALGIRKVSWLDMEITNNDLGVPEITLSGKAKKQLTKMTPKGHKARLLISMTDAYPFAQAQVMIVADPK